MKHPKRKQRLHDNWELYGEKQPHDSQLKLNGNDNEEKRMAAGLKSFLEDFSTVMLIVYQGKVRDIINPVSQFASKRGSRFVQGIRNASAINCKDGIEDVKEEAIKLAGVWGVERGIQEKESWPSSQAN